MTLAEIKVRNRAAGSSFFEEGRKFGPLYAGGWFLEHLPDGRFRLCLAHLKTGTCLEANWCWEDAKDARRCVAWLFKVGFDDVQRTLGNHPNPLRFAQTVDRMVSRWLSQDFNGPVPPKCLVS